MFLTVQIPPTAARAILGTKAEALNALLAAVGPDRDLVRCSASPGVSARFVHLVGPDPPPASNWVSWAAPAVLVVVFGLVTVPWRAARQFAVPFVLAFAPIAALAAWFVIGMDLFSPRTELAGAARAARELLLGLLDGPPGGTYVEGRDDRPWLDPEA
ncbi:hypothetical protein ACVH9Z_23670 [Rhodococcus opacus]|uniref:hypothetical protein n=1 Tax=Rhodococcus TaxID=1827 RepID=UPI0002A3024D|nr:MULTISPECIES: hypothetical protein [Rhodococcus]ELB89712.1 hypothetical protein Rwratislav_28144 [Rhodococcus wratislaviensis IFP 2016]NHU44766.1 hypothetical protein [Rhodococcus sp. A14]MBA8960805.1 hypothetical protein [Rhodococcus opacus]MBP2203329.1 hypothetical protein [Rhodococcus opacus]MDI9939875.1 hypothetical protein [Rhodococcus sp. IEGM 1351]